MLPWQSCYAEGEKCYQDQEYKSAVTLFVKAEKLIPQNTKLTEQYALQRILGMAHQAMQSWNEASACFQAATALHNRIRAQPNPPSLASVPSPLEMQFLSAAFNCNQEESTRLLADPALRREKYKLLSARAEDDLTLLMRTIRVVDNKHFDYVRYLVEEYAIDANVVDSEGKTVLHHAVISGQHRLVGYLCTRCEGLKVNATDSQGQTALHKAVSKDWIDSIEILLSVESIDIDILNKDSKKAESLTKNPDVLALFKQYRDAKKPEEKRAAVSSASSQSVVVMSETEKEFVKATFIKIKTLIPGTPQYFLELPRIIKLEKILLARFRNTQTDYDLKSLVNFYKYIQQHDKQKKYLDIAMRLFPHNTFFKIRFAMIALRESRMGEAKKHLQEAYASCLQKDDETSKRDLSYICRHLSKIYYNEYDYKSAAAWCAKYETHEPNSSDATLLLAKIAYNTGNQQQYRKLLQKLIAQNNDYQLMDVCYHVGNYKAAITHCNSLLASDLSRDLRATVLKTLAASQSFSGNRVGAQKLFKTIVKDYPHDSFIMKSYLNFMCYRMKEPDINSNIRLHERFMAQEKSPLSHLGYARFLWNRGQFFEAVEKYEEIASAFPQSINVHFELIQAYNESGLYDKTIAHCEYLFGLNNAVNQIEILKDGVHHSSEDFKRSEFYYVYIHALLACTKHDEAYAATNACLERHVADSIEVAGNLADIFYQHGLKPEFYVPVESEATSEEKRASNSEQADVFSETPGPFNTLSLIELNASIIKYFLQGKAEKFYALLERLNITSHVFPPETPLPSDLLVKRHAWIKQQLSYIDNRINAGRVVSHNEIYYIFIAAETYNHVESNTINFFSAVEKTVNQYRFDPKCMELNENGIGMMHYVYSCERHHKGLERDLKFKNVSNAIAAQVSKVSQASTAIWSSTNTSVQAGSSTDPTKVEVKVANTTKKRG